MPEAALMEPRLPGEQLHLQIRDLGRMRYAPRLSTSNAS